MADSSHTELNSSPGIWPKLGLTLGLGAAVGLLLFRRFFHGTKRCKSLAQLNGKTVVVTGANTGIGKATALDLARRNARVILACRDVRKAETVAAAIRRSTLSERVVVKRLDLASLASVNEFCDDLLETESRLDVLINNAGLAMLPAPARTRDGFEAQFGVNHLGHFLLTNRLLPLLGRASPGARVVVVSSALHKWGRIDFDDLNAERGYEPRRAYSSSKLANVLFARELHRRLQAEGAGVSVYTLHPGVVNTELGRHVAHPLVMRYLVGPLLWLLLKTPAQGAQTTIHCAVAGELEAVSGRYYGSCQEEPFPSVASLTDVDATAKKLWEVSEELTGLTKATGQ